MIRRLIRYAVSSLLLGSACAIYQLTFVAWLEPEPLKPIEFSQSLILTPGERLARIFPPDAWQLQNCKRLQTRDGVLLFEEWQQIGDDQWKLWPLTIVMGLDSDSPLVLDTRKGAEIKFVESLDVMSGGAPPIERGRLIGEVRIRSVGKAITLGDAGDGRSPRNEGHLEIISSDFGIDFRKIWTTQPIDVRLGDVQLAGRDLTLHLAPMGRLQPGGGGGMDGGAISVLDRMELIYLDELTVPLPDGGLWKGRRPGTVGSSAVGKVNAPQPATERLPRPGHRPSPPAVAKLRCAGRAVFIFGTHELTLRDRVQLEHRTADSTDFFECDMIRLRFADLLRSRETGERLEEISDYLLTVAAEGLPARILLPSFASEIAAERIDFDARSGLLQMTGRAGARISHAGVTWRFKQFNYQLHPDDPLQIGAFDAMGSGVVDFAGDEYPVKRLRWSDGIKLEQAAEPGQYVVRVDGNVSGLTHDGGEFATDAAMLVLQTAETGTLRDGGLQATRPVRFQATGRVSFRSPMVEVATQLLQVYFEFEPESPPAEPGLGADGSTALAATGGGEPHPLRRWVRQPDGESGRPGTAAVTAGAASPVRRAAPVLHGDTINAKLKLAGRELAATDLTVLGNVVGRYLVDTPAGPLPATVTGRRLQLRDTGNNEILQIGSGVDSPAKLTLGDGYFLGPLIQVRLADNIVWIKDAGEFQLPTQLLSQNGFSPKFGPIDAQAPDDGGTQQSIQWAAAPKCRWRGQLLFDGSRAVLTDGIDIRGAVIVGADQDLWDVDLVGDRLEVVLDQSVQLRRPDEAKAATVDHVRITSSAEHPLVITANELTHRGVRKSRHLLAVPELTLRPEAGTVEGAGPGWYRNWVRTEGAPAKLLAGDNERAGDPALMATHLVYRDRMTADLNRKSLSFDRAVRVAGRPVQNWDGVVDVETMHGLRLGESLLESDRLRIGVDPNRPARLLAESWELEATGDVRFQTRNEKGLFDGIADRAGYVAAKSLFVIHGSPGRSATLNRTLPTGAPGGSGSGKRLTVNTRTMEVEDFEFDRLQLGTLPNFSR